MSQKLCKKCQRPLPDGYKYDTCEHCRSEWAQQIKIAVSATLGAAMAAIALIKGQSNRK